MYTRTFSAYDDLKSMLAALLILTLIGFLLSKAIGNYIEIKSRKKAFSIHVILALVLFMLNVWYNVTRESGDWQVRVGLVGWAYACIISYYFLIKDLIEKGNIEEKNPTENRILPQSEEEEKAKIEITKDDIDESSNVYYCPACNNKNSIHDEFCSECELKLQ
ncbi:MAG: hypothetical protein RH916_05050 [Vicingaceae bacterium]